ncbi:MAG: DUF547 domain-containing protein [Acidobacteriota bacterium]|nr:MAG: DUF547 domain-containing protein [Acidobacteriota bacterium]
MLLLDRFCRWTLKRWDRSVWRLFTGFILLAGLMSSTGCSDLPPAASPVPGPTFETFGSEALYDSYAAVLEWVDGSGLVNYSGLKAHRQELDLFVEKLASFDRNAYEAMSPSEQIAFWINAYNGSTLLAIVNHYPIQPTLIGSIRFPANSIRQISGVWDELRFQVMGEPLTLDQIEHQILRKDFSEPRIHVALVCAALSCPPLRNEPFTGERLREQFDDQIRRFLKNPNNFRIDSADGTVYLSEIFDWYGEDFIAEFGTKEVGADLSRSEVAVMNYIAPQLSPSDARYLAEEPYRVQYLDYDWTLNEQRRD